MAAGGHANRGDARWQPVASSARPPTASPIGWSSSELFELARRPAGPEITHNGAESEQEIDWMCLWAGQRTPLQPPVAVGVVVVARPSSASAIFRSASRKLISPVQTEANSSVAAALAGRVAPETGVASRRQPVDDDDNDFGQSSSRDHGQNQFHFRHDFFSPLANLRAPNSSPLPSDA